MGSQTTSGKPTETTPQVYEFGACTSRDVDPTEPITIIDNGTVCVSKDAVPIKYCEDKSGKCDKVQERDIHGNMVSTCECCLPWLRQEAYWFDCFGEDRYLEIDVISYCTCMTCDALNSQLVDDRRSLLKKRAEMYLPGNVPFII